MQALSRCIPGLILLAGVACHSAPARGPLSAATAQPPQPISLLRVPMKGGKPALLRLPGLTPSSWVGREDLPAPRMLLGTDIDARLVYLLDTKSNVVAIDLEAGRNRQVLSKVAIAAVGPDGTLYTVGTDHAVSETADRTPIVYPGKLSGDAQALFAGGDESAVALLEGRDRSFATVDRQHPPVLVPAPRGEVASTTWGTLLAVAADTAVVLYSPGAKSPLRSIHTGAHVRHVAFSPSGHRLYVSRDGSDALSVFDRFTWSSLPDIDLPGDAGALRPDPFGRYLLVRPVTGDSVWVVDLSTNEMLGSWPAPWGADLPTVAKSRYLLIRQGQDVVSYDLASAKLPETGRVPGGAADLWLVLQWAPRGEIPLGPDIDSTALAALDSAPDNRIFVQVSSSQNPAWANELARKMKDIGLPAQVIKPQHQDEGYRVVLGPYPTREAAESTGKKLGQPYFIYTPDAAAP
ncbi:MAG: SPOR domain-containing protein [Gemmatimonadales bacterium]